MRGDKLKSDKNVNNKNIIDGEAMVQSWIEKDLQIKFLTLKAIKKLPLKVKCIEESLNNDSQEKLEFNSHDLKGFALNFNFKEIYEISKKINDEAKKEDYSRKEVLQLFNQLNNIVNKIPDDYLP